MQSNRNAALDLPLKALAWQDSNGDIWLVYNEPGYPAPDQRPETGHLIDTQGYAGILHGSNRAMKT